MRPSIADVVREVARRWARRTRVRLAEAQLTDLVSQVRPLVVLRNSKKVDDDDFAKGLEIVAGNWTSDHDLVTSHFFVGRSGLFVADPSVDLAKALLTAFRVGPSYAPRRKPRRRLSRPRGAASVVGVPRVLDFRKGVALQPQKKR